MKKTRKNKTKKELVAKNVVKNLNEKLQSIYSETVNLKTTCCHTCCCCKVAMPQLNYCEFINMVSHIWETYTFDQKIDLICKSIEYFFKNEYEKWGMESLIKPCMFLDEEKGMCSQYERRPLNCSLYGLWPEKVYNERVDKFEKIYSQFGLKREELPLNKQCPLVKRVDNSIEITEELINSLFEKLDNIDKVIGDFNKVQIKAKENYRTFHDWLLLKIYGEEWLSLLTTFMLSADKDTIKNQYELIQDAIRNSLKEKDIKINI